MTDIAQVKVSELEKARREFEAWYSENGKYPEAVERNAAGYKFMAADVAWGVWLASRGIGIATFGATVPGKTDAISEK